MKNRISANVIVKNAEDTIEKCLRSIEHSVDEIIVVDTGSTDSTINKIKPFQKVKLFHKRWTDDFSDARNFAIEKSQGDWIFIIDADEWLQSDREHIQCLLKDDTSGVWVKITNPLNNDLYIEQSCLRLFRNGPTIRFQGRVHEQIIHSLLNTYPNKKMTTSNLLINHEGYQLNTIQKENKMKRNIGLLQKSLQTEPKNGFLWFNLGVEFTRLEQYEKAMKSFEKSFQFSKECSSFMSSLYFYYIQSLFQNGDYKKSITIIEEAKEKYPDYAELWLWHAYILLDYKRYREALNILYQLLDKEKSPSNYQTLKGSTTFLPQFLIGYVYEMFGHSKAARQRYNLVISMNKTFKPVYKKLFQLGLSNENELVVYIDKVSEELKGLSEEAYECWLLTLLEMNENNYFVTNRNKLKESENEEIAFIFNSFLLGNQEFEEALLHQTRVLHHFPDHKHEKEWLLVHVLTFQYLEEVIPTWVKAQIKKYYQEAEILYLSEELYHKHFELFIDLLNVSLNVSSFFPLIKQILSSSHNRQFVMVIIKRLWENQQFEQVYNAFYRLRRKNVNLSKDETFLFAESCYKTKRYNQAITLLEEYFDNASVMEEDVISVLQKYYISESKRVVSDLFSSKNIEIMNWYDQKLNSQLANLEKKEGEIDATHFTLHDLQK